MQLPSGIPVEFLLFALTLLGVALAQRYALRMALAGLLCVLVYKFELTGFGSVPGWVGLRLHLQHEWVMLANLLALLTGFAVLAGHFEASRLPQLLPAWLPDGWRGGFVLLLLVFVLSAFLDNIAAAMMGGSVARVVFRNRVHVGYLAALVAAANAGGAGSVVGDTTTTMMWLSGVTPWQVLQGYVPATVALLVCGVLAAHQQQRFAPIRCDAPQGVVLDKLSLYVAGLILFSAIAANVGMNMLVPEWSGRWPVIGTAIWLTIALTAWIRRPDWSVLPASLSGAIFLLALVLLASLMPVTSLPSASRSSSFMLGWVSAVFDNIPLTKLALEQGGYEWGLLAYAVGFGGSMLWFGSSAGVALCSAYPQARSVRQWLRDGWHVVLAYVLGFAVYVWCF